MPNGVTDYAVSLRSMNTFSDLRNRTLDFFHHRGFKMMSYHHLPPPGAPDYDRPFAIITHGFPDDWLKTYAAEEYYLVDPIPRYALEAIYPFRWTDTRELAGLTKKESDYLDSLEAAGIGDGLALPVFGPRGRNGYLGLADNGLHPPYSDFELAEYHLAAQIAHLRYCYLLSERAPRGVALSGRETEILQWVARGKSNTVIAEIVGVSPNTVDTYVRRIFEKLDVSDRVTASLRGLSIGLIT